MNTNNKTILISDGIEAKVIPGFERYLATRDGRIWDTKRGVFVAPFRKSQDPKARPKAKTDRRLQVNLNVAPGLVKKGLVSRLVALAWIPNPKKLPMVNHIDNVKTNNHVENLEWVTAKQNAEHYRAWVRSHYYQKGYQEALCQQISH